jgi:glycosyltransferase involved in cell wall biosynthesis
MHIVYVSQYFPPEMGAPAARVYELSRAWVKQGHKVSVVTGFAHHPTGVKAPEDQYQIFRRETIDGVEVVRSYVFATANRGIGKRMVSYAIFMVAATLIGGIHVHSPHVVIATSPQLLCGLAGYFLAKRFRVPFVLEVRDLWPESILAVDAMRENAIVRGLRRVAQFLYTKAALIVTVGNGYKKQIHERYGISLERMYVVPNGIDGDLFVPGPRQNEIRLRYGWADRFVVLYVGTHGMAHALHVVLDAAEQLQSNPDILFVFVGEGAEKDNLEKLARDKGLSNIQFIDQQPRSRVPEFYSACDVGLVTLRDTRLFQSVLPSKIFEYLAMARPVLLSVDGEARALVEEAGAGWYVAPEDSWALREAILKAVQDRQALEQMGNRGHDYVMRYYDRTDLANKYLKLLFMIAGHAPKRTN